MNQQESHEAALQELQLALPLEASMMALAEPLSHWARALHGLMYASNPWMMLRLHEAGELAKYLNDRGEELSDQARKLEKQYRLSNPLQPSVTHLLRTSWNNQAKSFATETLMNSLSEEIVSLREQYQGTAIH